MDPSTASAIGLVCGLLGTCTALFIPSWALRVTGWSALCEKYPVRRPHGGKWINFQTMHPGPAMHFGKCVSVGLTSEFLYLKISRLVFPIAPQAQIPWEAISSIQEHENGRTTIVLHDGKKLCFGTEKALRSALHDQVALLGMQRLLENKQ